MTQAGHSCIVHKTTTQLEVWSTATERTSAPIPCSFSCGICCYDTGALTKLEIPRLWKAADTIRCTILSCAHKLTRVSLIYRTEPTTNRWKKKKKLKTKKTDRPLRSEVSVTVRRVRGVSPGFRIVGFFYLLIVPQQLFRRRFT